MLHVGDFTNTIGNPAKSFKWDIIVPALPVVGSFHAQTAQVPAKGHTIIDLFHMGQVAKFPGAVEYEHTWPVTFVESETGIIHNALWEWSQLVFNQTTGVMSNPNVFKRDITARMLTDNGATWATFVLHNCYPQNVDPVELDKSANTEAFKWTVTFSFDWWDRG